MRIIYIFVFLILTPVFSEEMTTLTIVSSEMNDPVPEAWEYVKQESVKNKVFLSSILSREKTIAGRSYSVTVPVGQLKALPSLMHNTERLFWRETLRKFTNYNFPVYPVKDRWKFHEDTSDTAWLAFLLSKYGNSNVLLYLKRRKTDFPLIVLLREGKIFAVDFKKNSRNDVSSQLDCIDEALSGGNEKWNKWVAMFEQSLVEKRVDKNIFKKLSQLFENISSTAKPVHSSFEKTLNLYKTDVNSMRRESNLDIRSVFNDNEYMFIVTPGGTVSFFMMELYDSEELPGMVYQLMYSLWHSCVKPDKNKFTSEKTLDTYEQTVFKLQKQEEFFRK